MLIYESSLIGTPILSLQASGPIGRVSSVIIDPNGLKIIAFRIDGPHPSANLLEVSSVREHSSLGMVIDSIDELVGRDDVVRLQQVLDLNFDLDRLAVARFSVRPPHPQSRIQKRHQTRPHHRLHCYF